MAGLFLIGMWVGEIGCTSETDAEEPALPDAMVAPAQFDCDALDYGLYWFGPDDQSAKSLPGEPNPYFDAERPTVIYVHGWEKGTTERVHRETFNYLHNDPGSGFDIDTADAWIGRGWNIGIFYWNQLADEDEVKDAEEKIWFAQGASSADASLQLVEKLRSNRVIFERYKTSNINLFVGDRNNALVDRIGDTELVAGWISPVNQRARHISAPFLYFQSFAFPAPPGCRGDDCSQPGPSAATPNAEARKPMENALLWIQIEGRNTSNSDDDVL